MSTTSEDRPEQGLPGEQPNQGWDETQPQDDRPLGQEGTEPGAGVPVTPQTNDPIQSNQPGYPSSRAQETIEAVEQQADDEESDEPKQTDTENFAADPNPRLPKEKDPAEGYRRNTEPRTGDEGEHSPAVDERLPNP